MEKATKVEPWLRGTWTEVDALRRQVLHALELAEEDIERWCASLSDLQINARPLGLASVAFHLTHIARSLDRLLTYAEGRPLDEQQRAALQTEMHARPAGEVLVECADALKHSKVRVLACAANTYEQPCFVGQQRLPATVGGLLIHCAEHTQRHVGQAITTARMVAQTVS